MSVHLTEEEQIEALKRWWNENGKSLTAAVVVALGGFWGWTQYQSYQEQTAQENSLIFQRLLEGVAASETDQTNEDALVQAAEVEKIAKQLSSEQSDTLYGNFADLYLAKKAVQESDFDSAKVSLQAVLDNPANDAVQELAQLRLARVLFAAGDLDGALTLLSSKVSDAYASFYSEVKGDIYLAQDDLAQARQAYEKAMEGLEPMEFLRRNLIQLKLDNTKMASDVPDISPGNPQAAAPVMEGS